MGSPATGICETLRADIKHEESRVRASFGLGDQLAVIELVRAIDHGFLGYWLGARKASSKPDSPEQLMAYGVNKALSLFLTPACDGPSVPLAKSFSGSQDWADACLQHCGRLGLCEQVIDYCRSGVGTIAELDDGTMEYRHAGFPLGMEALEVEEFRWLARIAANIEGQLAPLYKEAEPRIRRLMSERVAPWRDHFIQYEAHPDVDDYYLQLGISLARTFTGQDSFSGATIIGGKEFNLYRATVGLLIGLSLKHVNFCIELLKKHPHIDPRNAFTHFTRIDDLSATLAYELEVDLEDARQALSALTLAPCNVQAHCGPPGCASPSLIMISDHHVVRNHWGLLTNPFYFMLRELRRRYRSDWDRALDEREVIFRRDLFHLFPGPHILKIDRCIRLRRDGRDVTDIDAALLDERTGTLALIQLKWQDTFASMRERSSRKLNFLEEGNRWVAEVSRWLADRGAEALGRQIGLPPDQAAGIRDVRLFVIGRNQAHFSGPEEPDERAAWAVWPQVMRHRLERGDHSDPIRRLDATLREDSPRRRGLPEIEGGEIILRGRTIRLPTLARP